MKKQIIYILFFLYCLKGFPQKNETVQTEQNMYLYTDTFFGSNGDYDTYFSLKSEDKNFSHDNYLFKIVNPDYKTKLFNIGKRINIDSLKITDPKEYFIGKSSCDIHAQLSLTNTSNSKKNIFIVTKIPPERMLAETDKTKKYLIFKAIYNGTIKDFVFTQLGKNIFLRE